MRRLRLPRLVSFAAALAAAACASPVSVYGLRQEPAEIVSGRTVLRWEAFSAPAGWAEGAPPVCVIRVTYDLRVLDAATGAVVYERRDLPRPEHSLDEVPQGYRWFAWTVRPRVETTHGVRLGPWSHREDSFAPGRPETDTLPPRLLPTFRAP